MKTVIGLEFHIQLNTRSKAFSPERAAIADATPNTKVHPISRGVPGTLPVCNKAMPEKGIRLALSCQSKLADTLEFDRKHYFYPDLPKGYQITQHRKPLATGGRLAVLAHGYDTPVEIKIREMHLEEDSAKTLNTDHQILIDLNRAGIPLLELVTEPDIHNVEFAVSTLRYLQNLVRYLDISDGKMEDGSLRCDANISVIDSHGNSTPQLEVKNINSATALKHALTFEKNRLEESLRQGKVISSETRFYDDTHKKTISGRLKESSVEYRYLPEWDLQLVTINSDLIDPVRNAIPEPMEDIFNRIRKEHGLQAETARLLCEDQTIVTIFDTAITQSKTPAQVAKWLTGPLRHITFLPEKAEKYGKQIGELARLTEQNKITENKARELLPELFRNPDKTASQLAEEKNLFLEENPHFLINLVDEILNNSPQEVEKYKKSKKSMIDFFMGKVMKSSGGKVDPGQAKALIEERLKWK